MTLCAFTFMFVILYDIKCQGFPYMSKQAKRDKGLIRKNQLDRNKQLHPTSYALLDPISRFTFYLVFQFLFL